MVTGSSVLGHRCREVATLGYQKDLTFQTDTNMLEVLRGCWVSHESHFVQ